MGELDSTLHRALSRSLPDPGGAAQPSLRCAVVGAGRLGRVLVGGLARAGHAVEGPLARGGQAAGCDVALLCVADSEIAAAAAHIAPGVLVGHCSGASGLEPLGKREAFSLHPLMTVTADGADLDGAGCALAASSPDALAVAHRLAADLGMAPIEVEPADRAAYHAAASMASNYLVTLEAAAERVGATAGLSREHLVGLVGATVANWARVGPQRALTGPVARGDEDTVAGQRAAVAERAPELLALFDLLAEHTRSLAAEAAPA